MTLINENIVFGGKLDIFLSLFFRFGNAAIVMNRLIGELNHPMPFMIRIALPNPLVGLGVCQELLNL